MMTCLAVALTGCREAIGNLFSEPIEPGDEVAFTATTPQRLSTRSDEAPQTLKLPYTLTIGMYKSDGTQEGTDGVYTTTTDDEIGTLKAVTPLYWPSTQVAYGFKAKAGSETLDTDQTTEKKWLAQDRLETLPDSEKACKTAKEWKKLNESLGLKSDNDDYKKVPLVLYHQRALITVILKAGEGVSAKALYYSAAQKDIHTKICSYGGETPDNIMPLASAYYVDKDSTTRYDAIVAPHDYSQNPTSDLITRISLSGQSYSFYAGNDSQFASDKSRYNLEAGKHLILTVTLGRNSREVHMTAYIEDWTEEVTNTICDDYGNAGVPIKIKNRDELIDFLKSDEKNKPGNVALVTNNIDLQDWSGDYDLNCTLNLGGKTIISNHRFLKSMADAATLQNGTIQIGGTVDAAVAETNKGAIEDVRVTTSGATAQATAAGVVVHNTGTISKCRSALKVLGGAEGYVGGIAATSLSAEGKIAIIDGCTVSNSVKGGQKGGGIVGQANGIVSNNTFEYGITLLQSKETHKNIVGEKQTDHSLTAENNAWPTVDGDLELVNSATDLYSGIIDSGEELLESTNLVYNSDTKRYRLAQNISVSRQVGSIAYELDGNNKQISTSAMIFNAITGKVHDLTVMVTSDLIATPDKTAATDAIAALAFEVHGEQAAIERVNVKMADGTTIQASNPAGLVVWVYGGATVSGCEAKVNLYADVETDITQGRKFAGGLVSTVSRGTVTQCILHSGSTFNGTASTIIYYGGIVGGIEKKDVSNDAPALTITDCTSFVTMTKDEHHGAILGNAMQASKLATEGCQGNWWDADCNGVGTCTGYSVEQAIGKRNAVTPKE
jgi:hypothetical protein